MVSSWIKNNRWVWLVLFILAVSAEVNFTFVFCGVEAGTGASSFREAQMEADVVAEGQVVDAVVGVR
jgi:hypothetical protein